MEGAGVKGPNSVYLSFLSGDFQLFFSVIFKHKPQPAPQAARGKRQKGSETSGEEE